MAELTPGDKVITKTWPEFMGLEGTVLSVDNEHIKIRFGMSTETFGI